jgi:glycerophosphoryl diester phosphodiesterase
MVIHSNSHAFDWQGHRGCRGLYPENTIEAMKHALQYPITTLELDVVVNKDLEVIVSHEPWMAEEICLGPNGEAINDRQYNIYKMTYTEIEKFDCGSKNHPRFPKQKKMKAIKPKLSELLLSIEAEQKKLKKNISYNIEIKSLAEDELAGFQPDVKLFTEKVLQAIKLNLPESRFSIQSFDWRVLDYLSEKYPTITRVALIEKPYKVHEILKLLKAPPHVFSPNFQLVTKEDVDYLHSQKIKIIPWTLNTIADFKKLKSLGVDGIITDYPNLIP